MKKLSVLGMASPKAYAENEIRSQGNSIVSHLLYIKFFPDYNDRSHWVKQITGFLIEVRKKVPIKKGKRLTATRVASLLSETVSNDAELVSHLLGVANHMNKSVKSLTLTFSSADVRELIKEFADLVTSTQAFDRDDVEKIIGPFVDEGREEDE